MNVSLISPYLGLVLAHEVSSLICLLQIHHFPISRGFSPPCCIHATCQKVQHGRLWQQQNAAHAKHTIT